MTDHSTHCIDLIIQFVKIQRMDLLQLQANYLRSTSIVRYKMKFNKCNKFSVQQFYLAYCYLAQYSSYHTRYMMRA